MPDRQGIATAAQRKKSDRQSGVAIVEFTLSLTLLLPLLLGTFVYGFRLIRSLEMEQIVRDLGHMYVRGVNFRNSGPQQNAQTLASGFDLASTGTSLMIFSQVRIVVQADCDAANPGKPAGTPCTNLNNPVFTEQLTIGNTGLKINGVTAKSAFGTPTPLQSDFTVSSTDQANTAAVAAGDTSAGTGFAAVMTLNAGEFAYVVEMINGTPDLNVPGFSGTPQVYAKAVF